MPCLDLARDALSIVFAIHGGYLQSYEMDERKRILRSRLIVAAVDKANEEYYDVLWRTARPTPTPAALAHCVRNVLPRIHVALARLLRFVPSYVEKSLQLIPSDVYEAEDVLSAFRDEIYIRMDLYGLDPVPRFLKLPFS
jgi:hypothetical protein